jgi:hypothetical protein
VDTVTSNSLAARATWVGQGWWCGDGVEEEFGVGGVGEWVSGEVVPVLTLQAPLASEAQSYTVHTWRMVVATMPLLLDTELPPAPPCLATLFH